MVKLYKRTIALLERIAKWDNPEGLKEEALAEVALEAKDILKAIEAI